MEQVIFGGVYDLLHNAFTEYSSLIGGGITWIASEFNARQVVSTSGKIKGLRVKLHPGAPPGDGKSYTFTLMLNGAPSTLTVTITGTAESGVDTTREVDVVAGDTISMQIVPTNTPDVGIAWWTSIFEGATAKESLILGDSQWATLDNTATEYARPMPAKGDPTNVENDRRVVCPTSGKIKNLYVELSEDPGTSPSAYRFTLRKGGVSQALTVTITADDTIGHDTDHEVSVAAGNILTMMIEPLSEPSATPYANWGMTFVADIDGESIIMEGSDEDLHTDGGPDYNFQDNLWGHDDDRWQLGQLCTLKKLYILLSAAPGDDKSYTFTLRKGDALADGNLTVTITGAATTGNDTVNTDAIADDDFVDLRCTPANTPDVADAYWGLVGYIAPPAVMPWNIAPRVAMMGA